MMRRILGAKRRIGDRGAEPSWVSGRHSQRQILANPYFTGYKKITVLLLLSTKGRSKVCQWIGAILFLFFCALPLHVHAITDSKQISQECSCYCGGVSQLGSAPAPVVFSVADEVFFVRVSTTEIPVEIIVKSECARAPPSSI
jgi:hypothetical protein